MKIFTIAGILLSANFLNLTFAQSFIKKFNTVGEIASVGDILYFAADDGEHGTELWCSDGTMQGTYLVKDIRAGRPNSIPHNFIVFNDEIYFSADDGITGFELWKSDGTDEGTKMVINIRPEISTYTNSSDPAYLNAFMNRIFFTADDDGEGPELWETDGTKTGTAKVFDSTGDIFGLTCAGDKLYFLMVYNSFKELWETDGTAAGTFEVNVDDLYEIRDLQAINGSLYFTTRENGFIRLYCKSPGESECTLLKEFAAYDEVANITLAGSVVYFSARSHYLGNIDELWKTDGTPEGTVAIKTFEWDYHVSESYIRGFMAFKNELYFRGSASENTIWKSNGTEFGTVPVNFINSYPYNSTLTRSGNKLFYCDNGDLWTSDGTVNGTYQFADIYPVGNKPSQLTDINGTLYYVANDGLGTALWNSNPDPEITILERWNILKTGDAVIFDNTKVDATNARSLVIQNTGSKELFISGFSLSGNDFLMNEESFMLDPDEMDTLTVRFFPASAGQKSGQLTIFCNDNNEDNFVVYLKGIADEITFSDVLSIDSLSLLSGSNRLISKDTFSLTPCAMNEDIQPGSFAGLFEIAGENSDDFTFELVPGIGDEDNSKFYINDNALYTGKDFDFEVQSTHVIRVRAENNTGMTLERYFVLSINDVSENLNHAECGKNLYRLSYALNGIDFLNDRVAFAVGEEGVILRSSDGGEHWEKINSGTKADLLGIQFVSEETGFIHGPAIMKTENGGSNWFPLHLGYPGTINLNDMFFINPDVGFVLGNGNLIFKTTDGGRSWKWNNMESISGSAIFFIDENNGFLWGNSNYIWRTTDSGENWEIVNMSAFGWDNWFMDIFFTDVRTGYIAERTGKIFKTIDGGTVWNQVGQAGTNFASKMSFINNNKGFITGGWTTGELFKTEDGGNSWSVVPVNFGSPTSIAFNSSGEKGIIVGDADGLESNTESGSFIVQSVDYGQSWQNISFLPGDANFYDTRFYADGIGYLFGGQENGVACKTYDHGITWKSMPLNPHVKIKKCYYINKDTIFAVADKVYLTKDGGLSWDEAPAFNYEWLYDFQGFDTIYAVHNGNVYKTINAGQEWVLIYEEPDFFTNIYFINERTGFIAGWQKIIKTEDGGQTWSVYFHNQQCMLNTMVCLGEDIILVGGNDGKLMKSTDRGESWRIIATSFQVHIKDLKFFNEHSGIAFVSSDNGLGAFWETMDGGETWTRKLEINNIVYNYFYSDSGDIYFIGDRGAFYKYGADLPPSQAGYIMGEDEVCVGNTIRYMAPRDFSGTIKWNVPGLQNWISGDAAIVNCNIAGEFTIEATPVNGCGKGIPGILTVNIMNLPEPQILGRDTVFQNEKNVIYQPAELEGMRNLWHVDGSKYVTSTDVGKISVDWANMVSGKIDLIQTAVTTGCRQKVTKPIIIQLGTVISINPPMDAVVFPNPANEFLNIHITDKSKDSYQTTLYNESGKSVYVGTSENNEMTIDTGNLTPGNYILVIKQGIIESVTKVVIE